MEIWKLVDPNPGDHIRIACSNYYHHGIYIGDEQVVEFGEASSVLKPANEVFVQITTLEKFSQGKFIEVRQYDRKEKKKKNSPEKIIEIALSKIGEGGYNFIYNNCEHFANFCVFNEKISNQVNDVHEEMRRKLNL